VSKRSRFATPPGEDDITMPQYIVVVENTDGNTGTVIENGYYQSEHVAIVEALKQFIDPGLIEEFGPDIPDKGIVGLAEFILDGEVLDVDYEIAAYPIMQGPEGDHLRYTAEGTVGSEEVSREQ